MSTPVFDFIDKTKTTVSIKRTERLRTMMEKDSETAIKHAVCQDQDH
jgi:hypothetical protein